MKIVNNSENALCHGIPSKDGKNFFRAEVGAVIDVPDYVAELWLKIKGVEEYAAPADVKKAEDENTELKAKIKELEAKLQNKKKTTSKPKGAKKPTVKKGNNK